MRLFSIGLLLAGAALLAPAEIRFNRDARPSWPAPAFAAMARIRTRAWPACASTCAASFGRTPMPQGGNGRDHHIEGFSYLLAGGGIKPGITYGSTDELGYAAEEDPVSVHDLHATMLYLLGIQHERLAVKFQGLDVRLTGISGSLVRGILA